MQHALIKIGRPPFFNPNSIRDLTPVCDDKTSRMNINEIEKIVKIIKPQIKYP